MGQKVPDYSEQFTAALRVASRMQSQLGPESVLSLLDRLLTERSVASLERKLGLVDEPRAQSYLDAETPIEAPRRRLPLGYLQ